MRTVTQQRSNTGLSVRNYRPRRRSYHTTWKQMLLIVFTLLLLMGSSIGYVWSNFENTQIGYNLSQLKQEEIRLTKIQQRLRVELAYLKSPQRLLS